MADIELVIKIPEEDLDAIEKLKSKGWASRHELSILNGIRLPKGHGRLIDADRLMIDNPLHMGLDIPYVTEYTVEGIIDHAPTIIGADKVESEV